MKNLRQLRTLLLLLAMLVGASGGWAQEEKRENYGPSQQGKIDMVVVFNPKEFSLDFAMVVGTTFGGSDDGHCAFQDGANVTIGDAKFTIWQKNGKHPNELNSDRGVSGVPWEDILWATIDQNTKTVYGVPHKGYNGETKLVASYRKKLKMSDLGKNLTISLSGKFWRRGDADDWYVSINSTYRVPTAPEILEMLGMKGKLEFGSLDFIQEDGKPYAKFNIDPGIFGEKEFDGGEYVVRNTQGDNLATVSALADFAPDIIPTHPFVKDGKFEEWKYTTTQNSNWETKNYSDASWQTGKAPFGTQVPNVQKPVTSWTTRDIYLRKTLNTNLTAEDIKRLAWSIYHDEDVEIYVNGKKVYSATGYLVNYRIVPLSEEAQMAFVVGGPNLIAVHVKQTVGGQLLDLGLGRLKYDVKLPLGTGAGQLNPDELDRMTLTHNYFPCKPARSEFYSTEAAPIPMNAYPLPQNVTANYTQSDRTIRVDWELSRAPEKKLSSSTNNSFDDVIRVQFIKDGEVLETVDKSYNTNITAYNASYTVPAGEEADYQVSVARVLRSADGKMEIPIQGKTLSVGVNSRHYSATNVAAAITGDGSRVKVTWDIDGGVWSDGSRAYLSRYDESTGRTEEIDLNKSKFEKREYLDASLINYHDYVYKLIVEPGGEYQKTESNTSSSLTPFSEGSAISIEASQGEFNDKVNVKWVAKNFNVYSIERRRADDPADEFSEIYRVDNATSSSSNNSYIDELIMPGIIYTYKVVCKNVDTHGNVLQSQELSDYGFCKAAGDLNGKVVFEDGSAVKNADVRLSAYDEVKKYSLGFSQQGENSASLLSDSIMTGANEFTLQAMVRPQSSGSIIYKDRVFSLGISSENTVCVGKAAVSVADTIPLETDRWYQLTATADSSFVNIYINGTLSGSYMLDSISTDPAYRTPFDGKAVIELGRNFKGNISEVRLWSRALTADEVAANYNRYIVGNEQGLEAYFNFTFACQGRFFDSSYKGTLYNRRHGVFNEDLVNFDDSAYPSDEMLAYAGKTDESGIYMVRNILYYGNGTSYKITPILASHRFDPVSEVRFFSPTAANHTINYTDKSSFQVPIRVKYSGGDYPVEGVRFEIDGETVMKENKIVTTDANGEVTINVPIGYHKVQAIKEGHNFSQDGYLVDMEGNKLNYQNDMNVRTLSDETRVLFVGRVAGGATQGNLDLGFGLSKNNLSANSTVTFTPIKEHDVNTSGESIEYEYQHRALTLDTIRYEKQMELGIRNPQIRNSNNNKNKATWNKQNIVANVAEATGEFHVWLLPERYTVSVKIPGQNDTDVQNIEGNNAVLDMTGITSKYLTTTLTDSIVNNTDKTYAIFSADEKFICNGSKVYTLRVKPTLSVEQMDEDGNLLAYYGDSIVGNFNLIGKSDTLTVWNNPKRPGYYFGKPIITQGREYNWKLRMSEDYTHNETKEVNHVACDNVEFSINNQCAGKMITIAGDSITGTAMYTFNAGDPELSTGMRSVSIQATYGSSNNKTAVNWKAPFADAEGGQMVYHMGSISTGSDFVTAGPDKVLFVLRDPPGTNSYAYLSEGVSWEESSTYTGKLDLGQEVSFTDGVGITNQTIVGFSWEFQAELIQTNGFETSFSEKYTGVNGKKRSWSTARGFKTSNKPTYVGADGDVFVGYSTNLVFGRNDEIALVDAETYKNNPSKYAKVYTSTDDEWVLASRSVTKMGEKVNTMFDYAQKDIEKQVLPRLDSLRASLFTEVIGGDVEATRIMLEKKVEEKGNESQTYYLSKVPVTDKDYCKPGSYYFIHNAAYWSEHTKIGEYVVEGDNKTRVIYHTPDSVHVISQWIQAWKDRMGDNEDAKINATKKVENYSFSAGSAGIDYKETYSTSRNASHGFTISMNNAIIGNAKAENKTGFYTGVEAKSKVKFGTEHGNTWASSVNRNHTYGFTLQDDDIDNQLSVDVFREPNWDPDKEEYSYNTDGGEVDTTSIAGKDSYSTFIFKKIGGSTSTPYEGAQVAKYSKSHAGKAIDAATMQVDKPIIKVVNTMTEGVPMGDVAYVDIELSNASESYASRPYMLKPDDETVPDGLEITIDGVPIKNCPVYKIGYGETVKKTLAIRSGKAMNYDNIRLLFCANHSTPAIADQVKSEARFSVHFVPSSSPVALTQPSGEWNYNTELPTMDHNGRTVHYMPVTISGYDINYPNFSHLSLQTKRKGQGDDKWIDQSTWTKEQLAEMQGTINYSLLMDDYADDNYELRAVTYSDINNIMYERSSEIRSGVKDMVCPRSYGDPSPVNGILTPGENIEISFNEPIAQGYVNKEYISVTGVLNGSIDSDYSTYVALDGWNGHLISELEYNYTDKPLTIEMNVRPKAIADATFFAHGDSQNNMELGITADRRLVLTLNGMTVKSANPVSEENYQPGVWTNIAVSYDPDAQSVSAYCNGTAYILNSKIQSYTANGPIMVGRTVEGDGKWFHGDIASMRIWQAALNGAQIMEYSQRQLSGRESGLMSCYNIDEGKGTVLRDATRGFNLMMEGNATWTLPEGRALQFEGEGYASLDATKAAITNESDWTLQFWFRTIEGGKNCTLISAGEAGEGEHVDMSNRFGIRFNSEGTLIYEGAGEKVTFGSGYNNGDWHCMGVTLSRTNGFIRFYIDGEMMAYSDADLYGGVQTSELTVGAKQTIYYSKVPTYSEFLTGSIDDIQLWNLCRSSYQMAQDYNREMTGTEVGLRGYWPFDYYHKWEQGIELDTTMVNRADPELSTSGVRHGALFSSKCAPVMDAEVAADIPFDFITSERSIMIMPTAKRTSIENRTLTISVRDIKDLHGNVMTNPYTWTALVRQDIVDWVSNTLTLNISNTETTEGTIAFANKSGSSYGFSITNIPAWMHIDETDGTCDADAVKTISYSIDKGMAVGNFDDVIYLNVEGQVPAPLYVTARVRGIAPDWKPANPQSQFKANVFGQIKFNGHFSHDKDDMLAAFAGSKCLGVAHTSYDYDLKMFYALLAINYDIVDTLAIKNIEFRAFNASTGYVHRVEPDQPVVIANNAVYGTPSTPVVFLGTKERVLYYNLKTGWNWVSLPLKNALMKDKETALDLVVGEFSTNDIFKSYNATCKYTNAGEWYRPERFTLSNDSMYMIRVKKDVTMTVTGEDINSSVYKITVKPRWNWISYIPNSNLSLKQALAGYVAHQGDIIKNANEFAIYDKGFWVGSLKYMEPGCGYMLYNNSNSTSALVYPSSSSTTVGMLNFSPIVSANSSTMNMIAEIEDAEEGDILVAHTGEGDVEATPVEVNGRRLHFLSLSDNEGAPLGFSVKRGEDIVCAINSMTYAPHAVDGSIENPVRIVTSGARSMTVYPVPAVTVVNVDYELDAPASVAFSVFDVQGRLVKTIPAVQAAAGSNTQQINVTSLSSGHYFVRKTVDNVSETVRFIKK